MAKKDEKKLVKIMFSGGGTGGSVIPLLAVAEGLTQSRLREKGEVGESEQSEGLNMPALVFVGTPEGPERELVQAFSGAPMKFIALKSGKWRRYFSLANFFDLFVTFGAFFRALKILKREAPDLIITAGSFISVPLLWAAAFKRIPSLVHQEDVRPGLANRLMAPFARFVTVTFSQSLAAYGAKAVLTGNPVRDLGPYKKERALTKDRYGLAIDRPLILIIGGGTGAQAVNELVFAVAEELGKAAEIVHLLGKGKGTNNPPVCAGYQTREFLANEEVLHLMAAADLVVSRAGLGVLTELAVLKKPMIIIPIPDSHQEDNARVFANAGAAVVLEQRELTPVKLSQEIKRVLADNDLREKLGTAAGKVMAPGAAEKIAALAWKIMTNEHD